MAGAALGREVPVKGRCPGAASPGTVQGEAGLRARPTAGCPARAQPALPGRFNMERKREKERQAEAGQSFHQGCSGVLRAGVKVHRGKGRVRGLEGGGHGAGAQASCRQRGIPQKRPLELHREGKKEQERKRERKREGESVTAQREAQDEQIRSRGAGGWAATRQVTGCGQAFGRGAIASQGGTLGLLAVGLARLLWHGVRASQPSLTHASCAVLVGLKAPAAALVAAAAVPAVGVDADGLVPGADEGEPGTLVSVCKQRGLSVRQQGWELWAAGHGCPGSPWICCMTPLNVAMHKLCLCPGGSRHGHPAASLLPLQGLWLWRDACHMPAMPPAPGNSVFLAPRGTAVPL